MANIENSKSRFIVLLWMLLSFHVFYGNFVKMEDGKPRETIEKYLLRLGHHIKSVAFGEDLLRNQINGSILLGLPGKLHPEDFKEYLQLFRRKSTSSASQLVADIGKLNLTNDQFKKANRASRKIGESLPCSEVFFHIYAGIQSMSYFMLEGKKKNETIELQTNKLMILMNRFQKFAGSMNFEISENNSISTIAKELEEKVFNMVDLGATERFSELGNYFNFVKTLRNISGRCLKVIEKPEKSNLAMNNDGHAVLMWDSFFSVVSSKDEFEKFLAHSEHDGEAMASEMFSDMKWLMNKTYLSSNIDLSMVSARNNHLIDSSLGIEELDSRIQMAEDLLEVYSPIRARNVSLKFENIFTEIKKINWSLNFEHFSKMVPNLPKNFDQLSEMEYYKNSTYTFKEVEEVLRKDGGLAGLLMNHVNGLKYDAEIFEKLANGCNLLLHLIDTYIFLTEKSKTWSRQRIEEAVLYEIENGNHLLEFLNKTKTNNNSSYFFSQENRQFFNNYSVSFDESFGKVGFSDFINPPISNDDFEIYLSFLRNATVGYEGYEDALRFLQSFDGLDYFGSMINGTEEKDWLKFGREWVDFQLPQDIQVEPRLDWLMNETNNDEILRDGWTSYETFLTIYRKMGHENLDDFEYLDNMDESQKIEAVIAKLIRSAKWMKLSDGVHNFGSQAGNIEKLCEFMGNWSKTIEYFNERFYEQRVPVMKKVRNMEDFLEKSVTQKKMKKKEAEKSDILSALELSTELISCALLACNCLFILYAVFGKG